MNWQKVLMEKVKRHGKFKIKNILVFTFIIVVCLLTSTIYYYVFKFFQEVMTNNLIESAQAIS